MDAVTGAPQMQGPNTTGGGGGSGDGPGFSYSPGNGDTGLGFSEFPQHDMICEISILTIPPLD